jgi:hypothetical protein
VVTGQDDRRERFLAEVQRLTRDSEALLGQGADSAHHMVYREAVQSVVVLAGTELDARAVSLLRAMYRTSMEMEHNAGTPLQPTYRRGLVAALAAWLTVVASERAGHRVVVSPAEARPVIDHSRLDHMIGELWEPEQAVEAALRRDRRGGGPVVGDPPDCEGNMAFGRGDQPPCDRVATQRVTVELGIGVPATWQACEECSEVFLGKPGLDVTVAPLIARQWFHLMEEHKTEDGGYIPVLFTEGSATVAVMSGQGDFAAPWVWGKTRTEALGTCHTVNKERFGITPDVTLELMAAWTRQFAGSA